MKSRESTQKNIQPISDFAEYLKEKGLKVTNQRTLVAQKIFNMDSHFSVDHLANELRQKHASISRATIYRIISVMVEGGLLAEHNFGSSSKIYEHISNRKHHDHIICLDCGSIQEFCNEEIETAQLQIAKEMGFELSEHSLNLYGHCVKLKKSGSCSSMKKSTN